MSIPDFSQIDVGRLSLNNSLIKIRLSAKQE